MTSDIQQIHIIDAFTAYSPSRHIEYSVQTSTPTRTWSVNRRYNDFCALDAELRSATGKEPPATLPPKHWFNRTMNDEEKIRQRRVQLETYLRVILTTKDGRWRNAYGYSDFLAVPTTTKGAGILVTGIPDTFTSANWLTEHSAVEGVLRGARAAMLKRDALARMGDNVGGRQASGEARKALRESGPRIDGLERGLATNALLALGDGERRRRDDMIAALRAEQASLLRMAEAGFRAQRPTPPGERSRRGSSNRPGAMPGSANAFGPPAGRVFGRKSPAPETTETRALDDHGLVQLQVTKMKTQDEQLGALSGLLQKQRKMGEEIATEIALQNEMLEQIDNEVGRVGNKLSRAKRTMNKLG